MMLNRVDSDSIVAPDIDIISVKMLRVMGIDTSPLTFKVRRRLFGCCDDSVNSVSDTLSELETEDVQRSSRIWNFDFRKESPLPAGRYAWEKVRDCDVPLLYACEGQQDTGVCRRENRLPNQWDINQQMTTTSKPANCNQMKKSCLKSGNVRLVQTSIKGYGKVQKKAIKKLNLKRKHVRFLKSRVVNYIINDRQDGESAHS